MISDENKFEEENSYAVVMNHVFPFNLDYRDVDGGLLNHIYKQPLPTLDLLHVKHLLSLSDRQETYVVLE